MNREITECCPFCDTETTWENAPIEQKWGICKTCGAVLHFCDECMYNNNDRCNPKCPTAYCYEKDGE
jgi:hypothetical protein